ncbi:MAG: ABC transporter permease [Bacillota bacterium]
MEPNGAPLEWERKRLDLRTYLRGAATNTFSRYLEWTHFLPNTVLNLIDISLKITIFFLMARYVEAGAAPLLAEYGGSYTAYMVLGVVLNLFLNDTMNVYYQAYAEGYWSSSFEVYNAFPIGIPAYMTGSIIFRYAFSVLYFLVFMVLGVTVFHVDIRLANPGAALTLGVLGVAAVTGLGLIAASTFTLMNAKNWNNPVSWLVDFLVGLVAGVYFPPQVMPVWLQRVGAALPQTHVYRAMRLALLKGDGLLSPTVWPEVKALLVMTAVLLPVGIWLFRLSLVKGEKDGALTRWN